MVSPNTELVGKYFYLDGLDKRIIKVRHVGVNDSHEMRAAAYGTEINMETGVFRHNTDGYFLYKLTGPLDRKALADCRKYARKKRFPDEAILFLGGKIRKKR